MFVFCFLNTQQSIAEQPLLRLIIKSPGGSIRECEKSVDQRF